MDLFESKHILNKLMDGVRFKRNVASTQTAKRINEFIAFPQLAHSERCAMFLVALDMKNSLMGPLNYG